MIFRCEAMKSYSVQYRLAILMILITLYPIPADSQAMSARIGLQWRY